MRTPTFGKRALTLAVVATFVLAACGDGDDATSDTTAVPGSATTSGDGATASTPDDTTATTNASGDQVAADDSAKPQVQIPAEPPTTLVVTELIPGDGPVAEVGDTITVDYVGVRSVDGVEFDNSYDRGQPFPLVLGIGRVIQGWDQGLVGAREGARIQLDIPPDLAYGDQAAGEIIRPDEALTFVVDIVEVEKRSVATAPPMADPAECPAIDGSEPQQREFSEMQPFCIDVTATYTAEVVTNFGPLTVELDPQRAPITVNNFVVLARYHYFDGTECHRAIPDFVVQCGDPTATGTGGPGYRFPDELPLPGEYQLGSVAMANSGPDTNGSQFFLITGPNGASLPPDYSLFGEVSEGIDTTLADLNAVANPDSNGVPPLETILIESVTIIES